jgi:glycosyltransferase involved in cell wall biosynthesis
MSVADLLRPSVGTEQTAGLRERAASAGVRHEVLRIGTLATHPIQYHAPLYRALSALPGIELTVYYAHRPSAEEQGIGFGVPFVWDDDLLSGYRYVWLRNVADERRATTGERFRDRYRDYDTPEIGEAIRSRPLDVFLLHGWRVRSEWQAIRACREAKLPVMIRGDSQLRDDPLPKRWAKRILYRRLMRGFAACLSVGVRSEAYFRYYGATRVVRSPHFVDNDLFVTRAATAGLAGPGLRAEWAIDPSATVLLFAGKMVPRKRPLDIIRAVRGMPGVHVLFVGDGPLKRQCAEVADHLGVGVTFVGFFNQSAMGRAYAAADVLVVPSDRRETWGLVVNEAMACGRPAIVADAVGCAPDLILEGETGYTYPARDVSALRDRILRVLKDPGLVVALGRRAQERIAAYSAKAAADGVVTAARAAMRK